MQHHLMVAGCSFSAVSSAAPGTSWSELMAQALGWRLTNLARQGVSNGGIRIMIDEIIRQRPDFAVITPTFWDRMEIPAKSSPWNWQQTAEAWNPPLQRHLQNRNLGNGYDAKMGIQNINYGTHPSTMISETIFTLAENFDHAYRAGKIDKAAQTAIKHYIDSIYDSNWKKQQDEWIILEGVYKMWHAGIAFLFVPCLLWPWDSTNADLWRQVIPAVVPDDQIVLDSEDSVLYISGHYPFTGKDPGYHMSAQGQQAVADLYLERLHRSISS